MLTATPAPACPERRIEVLAHLPRNGPPGQDGLSYYVRRGNLLIVAVNTFFAGVGQLVVEDQRAAWRSG